MNTNATRLVAGVDSSTQGTKIEIRDLETGELVAHSSASHPATSPPRSEQDPASWWEAFTVAWQGVGQPRVAAISVAGQQHGMVVLDADRQVVRAAKLWNDTESAPDGRWLVKQLDSGAAGWAAATGSVPVAAFTIAKLSWLHRSEPESWSRLAHVLLPHDWMTLQLSGALVTDRGDASGTGYWSAASGDYQWDLLRIVDRERDWMRVVPRVLGPLEPAGTWNGAVVGCGTGDNMAAALSLGVQPGDTVISLGTSGTVYTVSEAPTADPSGAVAGFADATGRFLPLVCTLNAGKVLDAVRRLLGVDHAEFDQLVATSGSDGLTVLPYFDGERTPDLPEASGWMRGLRSDVSRGQLARAAVEGVACGLLDGLDALARHTDLQGRVLLTGGAARSSAVCSVLAALAERPVVTRDLPEAVAAGACVQAAAALTNTAPEQIARRWDLGSTAVVEPARQSVDGVRERYAQLRSVASVT
jgi:xylulokinase